MDEYFDGSELFEGQAELEARIRTLDCSDDPSEASVYSNHNKDSVRRGPPPFVATFENTPLPEKGKQDELPPKKMPPDQKTEDDPLSSNLPPDRTTQDRPPPSSPRPDHETQKDAPLSSPPPSPRLQAQAVIAPVAGTSLDHSDSDNSKIPKKDVLPREESSSDETQHVSPPSNPPPSPRPQARIPVESTPFEEKDNYTLEKEASPPPEGFPESSRRRSRRLSDVVSWEFVSQ